MPTSLVLACTHYPLIAPLLRRIVPAGMQIVDSAESTARVVRKMIEGQDGVILSEVRSPLAATERSRRTSIGEGTSPADHPTFRFYVTDSVEKFKCLATRFLGREVDNVEHVDLGG